MGIKNIKIFNLPSTEISLSDVVRRWDMQSCVTGVAWFFFYCNPPHMNKLHRCSVHRTCDAIHKGNYRKGHSLRMVRSHQPPVGHCSLRCASVGVHRNILIEQWPRWCLTLSIVYPRLLLFFFCSFDSRINLRSCYSLLRVQLRRVTLTNRGNTLRWMDNRAAMSPHGWLMLFLHGWWAHCKFFFFDFGYDECLVIMGRVELFAFFNVGKLFVS